MPLDCGITTVTMMEVQKLKKVVYVVIGNALSSVVHWSRAGESKLQLADILRFYRKSNFTGTWLCPSFTYC